MQTHKLLIWILIVFAPFMMDAQAPRIINFQHLEGFPSLMVNDIEQDEQGYIWLATSRGLYNFDGTKFRQLGKNSELHNANLASLYYHEQDSNLWITAMNGKTWRKTGRDIIFQEFRGQWPVAKRGPIQNSFTISNDSLYFYTYALDQYCFYGDSLVTKVPVEYMEIAFELVNQLEKKWQKKLGIFLQLNLLDLYRDDRFHMGDLTIFNTQEKAVIGFGNLIITASANEITADFKNDMILEMKEIDDVNLKSVYGIGLIIKRPGSEADTMLTNQTITKIFIDRNKGIWLGTREGDLFYIQNIHTLSYNNALSDMTVLNNHILVSKNSGELLKLKANRLCEITKLPFPVINISPVEEDAIAALGMRKISILKFTNNKSTVIRETINENDIIYDFTILDNRIYTIGNSGIHIYNIETDLWESPILSEERLTNITSYGNKIIADNHKGIWEVNLNGKPQKISNQASKYLGSQNNYFLLVKQDGKITQLENSEKQYTFHTELDVINHIEKVPNGFLISVPTGVYYLKKGSRSNPDRAKQLKEFAGEGIKKTVLKNDTVYGLHKKGLLVVPLNYLNKGQKEDLDMHSFFLKSQSANTYKFHIGKHKDNLTIEISSFHFIDNLSKPLFYRFANDSTIHLISGSRLILTNLHSGKTHIQVSDDKTFDDNESIYNIIVEKEQFFLEKLYVQILIFLITLITITLILQNRIKQIKRKNMIENAQIARMQTVLQQQMNPHFIFNSLTSINHFILQNKAMDSSRYLTKFSVLIRNILDNSSKEMIPLAEELETLNIYLELELLRFKDRFTYNINIAPNIDKNRVMLPPFILQPYVETALRDGIIHKPGKGNILLNIRYFKNNLQCTIIDDGIGRPFANKDKQKDNSVTKNGTQIAKQRIDLYNRLNSRKINVYKEDMVNHEGEAIGTKVILNFPVIYR